MSGYCSLGRVRILVGGELCEISITLVLQPMQELHEQRDWSDQLKV